MAQISVMMAAYNAEAHLRRALDSLIAQTFRDFDVIVVDDGSKDATGAIADEYAQRDSRIHVLHQENAGTCITRNVCLDWTFHNSDSQWILFADSDDWLHPEMLERMLKAVQELSVRICVCGYQETTGADPVIKPEDFTPRIRKTMDFYQESYVNAIMACCKLYHKSCYSGIRHPVENYHFDDEFVTYQVLYREENLAFIPAPLYAYFINDKGLTKQTWNPSFLDAWVAYEQQIRFFTDRGNEDLVRFRYRGYLENAMVNLAQAENYPDQKAAKPMIRKIKSRIRDVIRRAWKCGTLDFQMDFDLLVRFYPLTTKAYRFYLEKIKK